MGEADGARTRTGREGGATSSGSSEDRSAWASFMRSMHILFKDKECHYWEQKISSQAKNPKMLWKHLSTVLGRNENDSSPSFKPDEYLDFIEKKVKSVYDETSGAPEPTFRHTSHCLADLQPCSTVELERIIRSSPAKSCDLDPIPTFLLCEFLDDLLPFIHTMCNTSLSTGILPSSQKRAIVTPRLKKKEMAGFK